MCFSFPATLLHQPILSLWYLMNSILRLWAHLKGLWGTCVLLRSLAYLPLCSSSQVVSQGDILEECHIYIMTEDKKVKLVLGKTKNIVSIVYRSLFQANANYFWSSFLTGMEKKIFTRLMTVYHMAEDLLICCIRGTTAGQCTINVNIWLGL